MTVFVGGVGELFQGDLDLGRLAVAQLDVADLPDTVVEDLHYGAVAVAQRLAELAPETLLLVGAVARGEVPGAVRRRRIGTPQRSAAQLQAAVGEAITGYVHIDLVLDVATALGVLPPRVVAVEVEPDWTGPGEGLSPAATAGLAHALSLVRDEVRRAPLLRLAGELAQVVDEGRLSGSTALSTLRSLLRELSRLEREGRWGATFAFRDQLRRAITRGDTDPGMDRYDWALWWALLEELDRLEVAEAHATA